MGEKTALGKKQGNLQDHCDVCMCVWDMGDDETRKMETVVPKGDSESALTFVYQGEIWAGSSDAKDKHNFDNNSDTNILYFLKA